MNKYGIIFATNSLGAFSLKNSLGMPWKHNSYDMKIFKSITINNTVVMGRKTMESLKNPLPDRKNLVITSQEPLSGFIKTSFNEIKNTDHGIVWFIGGRNIIDECIDTFPIDVIVHNEIIEDINQDVEYYFLPKDDISKSLPNKYSINLMNNLKCHIYGKKINSYLDSQYLDIMVKILNSDEVLGRNGVVKSITDEPISITADFEDGFPIIQSKFTWMKGVKSELDLFMNGKTDSKILESQGNKIWVGNTSKEFIESRNLPYREGDMGPMYGFNWRHFGAEYKGCDLNYDGYDQYKNLIEGIIKDPNSRRHLLTTYDPSSADKGVLYPCHGLITQFFIRNDRISLKTYQRSADWFLGVPFNISSYALLLKRVIDEVNSKTNCKYLPGKISIIFGDIHLYKSHYISSIENIVYSNLQEYKKYELDENELPINYKARRIQAAMVV